MARALEILRSSKMVSGFIPLVMVAMVPIIAGASIGKRSIAATGVDPTAIDYPDYPAKYDEFPVLPKRAALLFDQLMVALQKVVDNPSRELGSARTLTRSAPHFPVARSRIISSMDDQTMDLQRRGQAKGRVYWRCYFNAVTCFRRK